MISDIESKLKPSVGRFIDDGADSRVYQFGDNVVKVYLSHVDLDQLIDYQDLTYRASEFLNKDHCRSIKFGERIFPYKIHVNPILYAGQSDRFNSQIISISEYIAGPRLRDFDTNQLSSYIETNLKDMRNLKSKNEYNFLEQLLVADGSERTKFYFDVKDYFLELSDLLDQKLNSNKIYINEPNIKIRSNNLSSLDFIITDLFAGFRSVKPTH